MFDASNRSGFAEWRQNWPLPLAAMIGFSTIGLQSYAFSPFVVHLEQEFGWTRAQAMMGVSLSNAMGIFLNIAVGMIVDRFGSRTVGLTGLVVMTCAYALLGTATGTLWNWAMLWLIVAVGVVLVQSTVWIRVVARRFDRARGMALAVALSGTAVTTIVAPVLATSLISSYGWRFAFLGIGALWLAVAFPTIFFLFHDDTKAPRKVEEPARSPADLPGLTFREGIRTAAFRRLLLSFGCFCFYSMTVATNIVPLLSEAGPGAMTVAPIASLMGIFGIFGRLFVGFLLDRYPAHIVGTFTLLLPVAGCGILLLSDPGILLIALAVATFGTAIGAEADVALYLATRHFGLKSFAALFGAIISFGALSSAIGPYVSGWLHDLSGNYDLPLMVIMLVMTIGALTMATMKRPA